MPQNPEWNNHSPGKSQNGKLKQDARCLPVSIQGAHLSDFPQCTKLKGNW